MTEELGEGHHFHNTQRKRKSRWDVQPSSIKDAYPPSIHDDEDDGDDHLKKTKTNSDEHRAKQVQHELRCFKEQKCCSAILAIDESSSVLLEENPRRRCSEKSSKMGPTVCSTASKNSHLEIKVEEVDTAVCTPFKNGNVEKDEKQLKQLNCILQIRRSFYNSAEYHIEPLVNAGIYASVKSQLSSVKTAKGQASSGNQPQVIKTETSHKNGSS